MNTKAIFFPLCCQNTINRFVWESDYRKGSWKKGLTCSQLNRKQCNHCPETQKTRRPCCCGLSGKQLHLPQQLCLSGLGVCLDLYLLIFDIKSAHLPFDMHTVSWPFACLIELIHNLLFNQLKKKNPPRKVKSLHLL